MPQGKLELELISALSLKDTDFYGKMEPYAILTCGTQEHKSTISTDIIENAAGKIMSTWNETFTFNISEGISELNVKLMDKDHITKDDLIGQATIPLSQFLFQKDLLLTPTYIMKHEKYCGTLMVAIKFFPEKEFSSTQEESYGGRDRVLVDN